MSAVQPHFPDERNGHDPTLEALFDEIRELLSGSNARREAPLRKEIDFLRRELAAASLKSVAPVAVDALTPKAGNASAAEGEASAALGPGSADSATLELGNQAEARVPSKPSEARVPSKPSLSDLRRRDLRARPITSHTGFTELELLVEEAKLLALEDAKRQSYTIFVPKSKIAFVDGVIDPLVSLIILVNVVIIGVSTDVDYDWIGWMYVDLGFTLFYIIEAIVKLSFLGLRGFFYGPSALWNRFDFSVICLGAVDAIITFASYGEGGSVSFVILRVLRLTRIGRILRPVHFKVFRELFTMLAGLLAAMRTLLWAFVILLFPMYTMSLMLTQFLGHVHQDDKHVRDHFSSVAMSLFMVFRCSTGDCSYADGTPTIMHITSKYGWPYAAGYVLGTMLITFGIFNLIMATFVDNALAAARRNEVMRMRHRLSDVHSQARQVSIFIERLWACLHPDKDLSDFCVHEAMSMTIAADQFEEIIEDSQIQAILEDLDVPEDDRRGLFDVLDADGGGRLEMEELIKGLVKLRGDPRRSDVVHVGLVVRSLQEEFRSFRKVVVPILTDFADSKKVSAPRVRSRGQMLV